MGGFTEEMGGRLPAPMTLPPPLVALFDWIEDRGLLHRSQRFAGDRYGSLQPLDGDVIAGTVVLFRVETPAQAANSAGWFGGGPDPEMARRLVPFARVGSDGSHAALWLDDEDRQRIVLLGSEGQACGLGATALDFLRLCAIGYGELAGDMMDAPGEPPDRPGANAPFTDWLTSTWGVTVPATASEIIGEPPAFDATDHADPFWRWVRARTRTS